MPKQEEAQKAAEEVVEESQQQPVVEEKPAGKPKQEETQKAAPERVELKSHWVTPVIREPGDPYFINVNKQEAKKMVRSGDYDMVYFIVNPAGAIHNVDREIAKSQLKKVGYRLAEPEEVQQLLNADGYQRADRPICKPFEPDPGLEIELD